MVKRWKVRVRKEWLAGALLLLPVLVVLPYLNTFLYPPQSGSYSDLAVTHYPNAYFLRQQLVERHQIPLWSPMILSGAPFAANPLSGLMYPPGWLALLLPLPAGLNLLAALHLAWGGLGMLRLLQEEGVRFPAALFGGLAFELMPKIIAHSGAGHLTLIYALSWTPWLLWVARVSGRNGLEDVTARGKRWVQPGLVLALIFMADVRWALYAGVLWWAYGIAHSHNRTKDLVHLIVQTGLALLISAPLGLPLLELTRFSTRANMTAADLLTLSLPPARLLGLIFPDFGGFHEWVVYPGALVLCLSLVGLVSSSRRFWVWIAILSLIASLGSSIPGYALLVRLPGFSLSRVPARALFVTGMALAALSGAALDAFQEVPGERRARIAKLILIGLAGFALILAAGVRILTGSLPLSFVWGAGAVSLAAVWLGWGLSRVGRRYWGLWFVGLLCLSLLDWGALDRSLVTFKPARSVLDEGSAAAQWLANQPGVFRVYSPSYSIPQQTAVQYRLQLADGVDPLQLESYTDFMDQATGVPRQGYSVTLPPFANGDPKTANAGDLPNPELLGMLSVRYIAAAYDLPVDGLVLKSVFNGTRLYENLRALPRAWVQPFEALPGVDAIPAQITDLQPNRISAQAMGPGLFVLSEISYPGWRAFVDGINAPIETVAGLLRGVRLESGSHKIDFVFMPVSLYIGLALCGIGLALQFISPHGSLRR